jgi:hypothetical protein
MNLDLTLIIDLCKRVFPDAKLIMHQDLNSFHMYGHAFNVELVVRGYHARMELGMHSRGMDEKHIAKMLCGYVSKEMIHA